MTTTTTTAAPVAPTKRRLTVLPDPPKRPDMATQSPIISKAQTILEHHFRQQPDTLVMANGYLRAHSEGTRGSLVPDCLVAFGLPIPPEDIVNANGYIVEEIGQPPDFVLEVASETTGQRDYEEKPAIYAAFGVREYWRFDRTGGQFHDAALAGDSRQPNGEYAPIETTTMPDGVIRGYSAALGLELRWVAGQLRFWDPATGEHLPDLTESMDQRDEEAEGRRLAEAQRDEEAEGRRLAEAQRDEEAEGRRLAEAQRDEEAEGRRLAEAQNRRLEAEIRRLQGR